MNRYTIHCTEEQTKKALELGAPIDHLRDSDGSMNWELDIPTAEQMIGWLRSKNIQFHFDDETNYWNVWDTTGDITPLKWYGYSDNKELDAIDVALKYLTNNKE